MGCSKFCFEMFFELGTLGCVCFFAVVSCEIGVEVGCFCCVDVSEFEKQ